MASGIPIAVIALLRAMKIKVLEAPNVYSSVLHRTETSASTAPMMMTSPSTQVSHDITLALFIMKCSTSTFTTVSTGYIMTRNLARNGKLI